jgi:transposase
VRAVHDWTPREIRDLPIFDADTILMVWRARLAYSSCGPKVYLDSLVGIANTGGALDWLEPYARFTYRLAESVARLCKVMPIKRVAEHYRP